MLDGVRQIMDPLEEGTRHRDKWRKLFLG